MSGTSIFLRFLPHRRAAALIDLRIDALRGDDALSPADDAFLDAHLAACAECRAALASKQALVAQLRGLGPVQAPQGFAGRVLMAARARGREVPAVEAEKGWLGGFVPSAQLATGALLTVIVLGSVGLVVGFGSKGSAGGGHVAGAVETGGTGLAGALEAPHFLVRAPGLGAAKVRSQVTTIVRAHGGTFDDAGAALIARIPRSALIAVTQDLASRGRYKMSKAGEGELPAELDSILIRFELE